MKYILIANNKKLTLGDLDQIPIDPSDIIILFNSMLPFFLSNKIKDHPNKIIISRQSGYFIENLKEGKKNIEPYASFSLIEKYQDYFNKIIFHSSPDSFKKKKKDIYLDYLKKSKIKPDKVAKLPPSPQSSEYVREFKQPKGKSCSSGLLAYWAYSGVKKEIDSIVLVGFTHNLVEKFHSSAREAAFFQREIDAGRCQRG